ncbi:MAG: hypothetical protein Q7R92_04805 [bacterium]|nr:hypothetical protein [bacterium]
MVTTNSLEVVFTALNRNISEVINCIRQLEAEESVCLEREGGALARVITEVKPLIKYLDNEIVVSAEWAINDLPTDEPI